MVEQSPSHSKTYFKMFSSKNTRLLGPALISPSIFIINLEVAGHWGGGGGGIGALRGWIEKKTKRPREDHMGKRELAFEGFSSQY